MKTNKQLLAIAVKQIGNSGSKYRHYVGQGGSWCDMFVFWLYDANGNGSLLTWKGKQRCFCPSSIEWCRKNLAEIPPYLVMPCDIIYFDWEPNGKPNHVGIVESRISTSAVQTIEGNTNGGKVARKKRNCKYVMAIYRPHFPTKAKAKKLDIDGVFGYNSIYNLQRALGMKPTGILTKETVKFLQKKVGATPDSVWGPGTSKKTQTFLKKAGCYTGKIDGDFGPHSVRGLQTWTNKINYPSKKATVTKKPATTSKAKKPAKTSVKTTNAKKLVAKMKELAWPYGTAKKKYAYKTGSPTAKCKVAMKKYGWADNRAEMSDCGNFVSTVVRQSGVDKHFKALHGVKTPFPKKEDKFKIVLSGKAIPNGFLKPGDIIRYKKLNGKQHAMFFLGDGKICEASHHTRFGVILKDTRKYNKVSKKKTIQVLRAK